MGQDSHLDVELIDRFKAGNYHTLSQIFERFRKPIYRYCCKCVGPEDAEDVAQEVWIKVLRSLPTFKKLPDSNFSSWLYRITSNSIKDWARRHNREPISLDTPTSGDEDGAVPDPPEDVRTEPEYVAIRNDHSERIRAAVASLPVKQRMAIMLFYFKGKSLEEISEITHAKIGTVGSRLSCGRKQLQILLASDRRVDANEQLYYCQLVNPQTLAQILTETPRHPAHQFIWDQFPEEERKRLTEPSLPRDVIINALAVGLNAVIFSSDPLYHPSRFEGIVVPTKVQLLVAKSGRGQADLRSVHRKLLEVIFKGHFRVNTTLISEEL